MKNSSWNCWKNSLLNNAWLKSALLLSLAFRLDLSRGFVKARK
jgi:hypothetical protein